MIYSGNTTLRAPLDSDVSFFATLRNDLDIQSMLMSRARGNTEEQVSEWLRARSTQPDAVFFVIASKADNKPIGFVQLMNIDHVSQCGELGICLCAEYQGKDHAKNTLAGFEKYLLNSLNITKIVLNVLRSNVRALEFYERNGFREVGTYCKHHYYDGEFHDVCLMEKCTGRR